MAQRIAQITLLNGVQSIIKAFPTGIKGFLIGNESGFTCDVQLENGDEKTLYPGTVDYYAPGPGFSGIIFVRPSINIQTAILYPSQTLWVDAVSLVDDISVGSYPMQLSRPMTAGTTSPQTGFSIYVVFTVTSTPTARYMLNLFNSAASGSQNIKRVYAAQIKHAGSGYVTGNLSVRTDGTDNNFPNAATIINHNIGGGNDTTGHATFANNTAIPAQNTFVASTQLDNDMFDFLSPPDAVYLNPQQNLTMDVQDPTASDIVYMTMKYTNA